MERIDDYNRLPYPMKINENCAATFAIKKNLVNRQI